MIGIPDSLPNTMTVFCDFDGPLVDVSNRYYSTYRLALTEIQKYNSTSSDIITPLAKAEFWQMKQERIPDIDIAKKSGLPVEAIDPFLSQVNQIVNHPDLLHQDVMQPGVGWALHFLHSQQVQLVLVTLRAQEQAQQILQAAQLDHLFSGIYGTHGAIDAAYQNSIELKTQLLRAAAAIHWPPAVHAYHPAWMIGDTEADIWAGRNLDIPTIALTCGIRSHKYLQKQSPTLILADLVSATNHLVRSSVSCA
jgi:phosphoglycolate phosphatase-like HAD superfamily hydrolase